MADTVPTPVAGGDGRKGAPDGVNSDPSGRTPGGESAGGAYPNPHTDKDDKDAGTGGFMGHGGQSHQDYSGTGDKDDKGVGNVNAVDGE